MLEVVSVTASGKELLSFVQEIRRFSTQLADLLGTADKLMSADGWEVALSSNVAYASPSASIDKPNKWFPYEVFRFYSKDENPRVLAMMSVLLDQDRKGEYQVTEPLACAGWFEFSKPAPTSVGSEHWWWARFHGYMPNRRDDGALSAVEPKTEWPAEYREDWYPFERATTFALPLCELSDTLVLEERLVKPLLKAVRETATSTVPRVPVT